MKLIHHRRPSPPGFYWVRYGNEWQVARKSLNGWFLTGVCDLLDDNAIDEIGEPCMPNEGLKRYRRASLASTVLLILAGLLFLYSLLIRFFHFF